MQNVGAVQEQQAFQELLHIALELIDAELVLEALGVEQTGQVVVHVLEHEVDGVQIFRIWESERERKSTSDDDDEFRDNNEIDNNVNS
jgi:hypothetical protein